MLARIEKAEITKILKEGRGVSSPLFSIKFIKNDSNKGSFCIIVSKKEARTAVKRNFIKRRIRSILSKISKNHKIPFKIIFFMKKDAQHVPFRDLETTIFQLFERFFTNKAS